ncbi:protein-lysine methyltransferase METTL21D-like isoform X2 [Coccinella septempunctata]|uniref:protein-lysine methyltransferase METTL21D-like isoform X2 n=1 Tax=Coccinella septempunctata TaxID=41139 RepID=UPI001D08F947|nr:protein-lysine methyltransferase METTL21D-like isoform X2 [Coccinella septempunctata]
MELEKGTFVREFEIPAISETLNFYQKIEGDVSCVVWDASMVLSKYLEKKFLEEEDFLKDCDVVELGAGLGCVGITAACLGARVIATDLPECIPLLDLNIDKNEHVWSKYGRIKSVPLKWGGDNNLDIPDRILLADCVYYEQITEISLIEFFDAAREIPVHIVNNRLFLL